MVPASGLRTMRRALVAVGYRTGPFLLSSAPVPPWIRFISHPHIACETNPGGETNETNETKGESHSPSIPILLMHVAALRCDGPVQRSRLRGGRQDGYPSALPGAVGRLPLLTSRCPFNVKPRSASRRAQPSRVPSPLGSSSK